MNSSIIKRTIKILLCFIILLIFQMIIANKTYASNKSKADIGEYIAEFSVNFANSHSDETVYSWDYWQRGQAYHGKKTSGYTSPQGLSYTNMYAMDCVGWVSFAIHNSTGLDAPLASSGASGFVVPQSNLCTNSNGYFEIVSGPPRPGDILINEGQHVMVYIGNGKVVDSTWDFSTVQIRNAQNYTKIARITDKGVNDINDSDLTTIFNGQGSITGALRGSQFEYDGLQSGAFGVKVYDWDWVLNCLKELLDWFIGIVTYVIRMVFVGWTGIVEELINNTMEMVTGEEASLTIEKLVYNKVPILDVNFFDFSTAGGETFEEDSILYVIRQNIASWYYIVRNISIAVLLVTLLYLGIRVAMTSIADEKAKYKDMLVSWFVSFAIVFSIHYIMIIILNLNSSLLELIGQLGGEESLYDSVRNGAYAIQASVGWRSLVLYMVLIYLLIRFLFVYIKRFIVIAILTLMAPLIGIVYSIDKIKDNKAQSFGKWLKEYTFNVIIQSVHALLYTLFVSLAFNIAGESFMGAFLAILLINFVLKAEGIFKKIFGIKSGSMKDVLKSTVGIMSAGKLGKKVIGANMKTLGKVASPVTKPISQIHKKANQFRRDDKINKVKQAIDNAKASGATSIQIGRTGSGISSLLEGKAEFKIDDILKDNPNADSYKIANDLFSKKEKIDKADKKEMKDRVSQTFHNALGVAEMAVAIPMTIVDGSEGGAMMVNAVGNLKRGINGYAKQNNKNYKAPRGVKNKMKAFSKNLVTAGAYQKAKNINRINRDYLKNRNDAINNAQYEILKKKIDKQIKNEYKRLLNNSNIDEIELGTVYQQAKTIVPEEIIQKVVLQFSGNINIEVIQEIEQIAKKTTELEELSNNINKLSKINKNNMKFDKKQFNTKVRSEIKKDIAKDSNIKLSSITDEDIADKFRNMSESEKVKLITNALNNSTTMKSKSVEKNKEVLKLIKNLEKIVDNTKELKDLKKNTKWQLDTVDNVTLKKEIEKQLREQISKTNKIPKSKVTQKQIDELFKSLDKQGKVDIMEKALMQSNTILDMKTKELKDEKLKTQMNLDNVTEIIDDISKEIGKMIKTEELINNFIDLIKAQISIQTGVNTEDVSDIDVDKHIYNQSNSELIKNIKEASMLNTSVVDEELRRKSEYQKLLEDIEKSKYYESKMKGKK